MLDTLVQTSPPLAPAPEQVLRPRPWRHRLAWLLGVRLCGFEHHPPRPLAVPSWYDRATELGEPLTLAVVTPSFNQGRFLEHTMSSVLDQGYGRLEYAVMDGGSTDDTPAVLARYLPRLRYLSQQPDGGQANAINGGFAQIRGDVMAYLNSDDFLLPGALHYVANWFAAHPDVDVVYGHRVIVDAAGLEIGRWVLPPHSDAMLTWSDYVPQETMFWRRRIWEKVGGAVDESFRFALDWDLLLRFRQAGARMVRLPRFLGAFRIHDQQKTSQQLLAIGLHEMNRLRRRTHGRDVSPREWRAGVMGYVLRHAAHHRLYQLGVARY